MTKKQKKTLIRIIVAAALLIALPLLRDVTNLLMGYFG